MSDRELLDVAQKYLVAADFRYPQPEEAVTAQANDAKQEPDDDVLARVRDPHRRWALENVRKAGRSDIETCTCWKFDTCVKCAHALGRSEGQVEAGAYYTMSEVFSDALTKEQK